MHGVTEQAVTENVQTQAPEPSQGVEERNQVVDKSLTRCLSSACVPEFTCSFFLIGAIAITNENHKTWRRRKRRQTSTKQLQSTKTQLETITTAMGEREKESRK